MKEIEVNGVRTAYLEQGSGDPVVLVHGLGGTASRHLQAPARAALRAPPRRRVRPARIRTELGHTGAVHGRVARRGPRRPPRRARPRHRDADRSLARRWHRPRIRGDATRPRPGGGRDRRRDRPPRAGEGGNGGSRRDGREPGNGRRRGDGGDERPCVVVPRGTPGGAPGARLAHCVERPDRLRSSVSRARRNGRHRRGSPGSAARCCSCAARRTRRLRLRRTERTRR